MESEEGAEVYALERGKSAGGNVGVDKEGGAWRWRVESGEGAAQAKKNV